MDHINSNQIEGSDEVVNSESGSSLAARLNNSVNNDINQFEDSQPQFLRVRGFGHDFIRTRIELERRALLSMPAPRRMNEEFEHNLGLPMPHRSGSLSHDRNAFLNTLFSDMNISQNTPAVATPEYSQAPTTTNCPDQATATRVDLTSFINPKYEKNIDRTLSEITTLKSKLEEAISSVQSARMEQAHIITRMRRMAQADDSPYEHEFSSLRRQIRLSRRPYGSGLILHSRHRQSLNISSGNDVRVSVQVGNTSTNIQSTSREAQRDESIMNRIVMSMNQTTGPVDEEKFFRAVLENRTSEVRLLTRNDRSTINVKDSFGRTALHIAASRRQSRMVRLLIKLGADVMILDRQGQTPFDVAISGNYPVLAAELLAAAAKTKDKKVVLLCEAARSTLKKLKGSSLTSRELMIMKATVSAIGIAMENLEFTCDELNELNMLLDVHIAEYHAKSQAKSQASVNALAGSLKTALDLDDSDSD